ncbi:hypothetical protein Tco_0520490 [Tanacetum coccineum]
MDDTQLIEADLVVDDENLLIETEIPDVDDIDVDKDAKKICSYSSNKVLCSLENKSVECTSRHFLRYGFLCRCELCVLKNRDIEVILEKYILRRRRSNITPLALRRNTKRYEEKLRFKCLSLLHGHRKM